MHTLARIGNATYLALGDLGLNVGPGLRLRGVGEEVHDDRAARDGLVDLEEVLAGNPAILDGVLPRLAILTDTDNDVEAVVAEVEALAVALRTVADEGEGIVLEVVLPSTRVRRKANWDLQSLEQIGREREKEREMDCDSQEASPGASRHALYIHGRPSARGNGCEKTPNWPQQRLTVDVLLGAGEVHRLHATDLLGRADDGGTSLPRQGPAGGGEGALLDSGRRHLAGQLRADRPAEAAGGHCKRCGKGEESFLFVGGYCCTGGGRKSGA